VRDTESRYWEHITAGCMTEESDDENGEKIVTHQLLWRSDCEIRRHGLSSSQEFICPGKR